MANPLDQFVSAKPGKFELRITPFPKLSDHISGSGSYKDLIAGISSHGQAVEQWRQDLERTFNRSMANVDQKITDSGITPTATTTTPTVVVSSPSEDPTTVHTDDEQALEKKTIGQQFPRPGKFTRVVSSNTIEASDNITIAKGFNMVVAGTLMVKGKITVDGTLVVL